jgi:hypothetical protein
MVSKGRRRIACTKRQIQIMDFLPPRHTQFPQGNIGSLFKKTQIIFNDIKMLRSELENAHECLSTREEIKFSDFHF